MILALSQRTGCYVEVRANGTTFRFSCRDTLEAAQDAFDRLYPESRLVMSGMTRPFPKEPTTPTRVDGA